jgi:hypothetical protein
MILKSFMEIEPGRKFNQRRAYLPCEWDTDPIRYRNRQWAVTDYGIENIRGPYHYYIPKSDLKMRMGSPDRTWVDHMAEKNWVDVEAFQDAFQRALKTFGIAT